MLVIPVFNDQAIETCRDQEDASFGSCTGRDRHCHAEITATGQSQSPW